MNGAERAVLLDGPRPRRTQVEDAPRRARTMRYRRPSPDELLPPDRSGLRAALAAYGTEVECVPDSDMIIGRRPGANAAAECVLRCRARATGPELEVLTHWQLRLLDDIDERRVAELERTPRAFIAKRDAKNLDRKAKHAERKAFVLAETARLQTTNPQYRDPRYLYVALRDALTRRYGPETEGRSGTSLRRYLKHP